MYISEKQKIQFTIKNSEDDYKYASFKKDGAFAAIPSDFYLACQGFKTGGDLN